MEKQTIFRQQQEVKASDFNAVQSHTRTSIDRLVRDALTDGKKFTGFVVQKSAPTAVKIGTGAYWMAGAVYAREEDVTIDMIGQLPLLTKKIAAIVCTSAVIETDVQQRDFVIDVETEATEPASVAMLSMRRAGFAVLYGDENSTPVRPPIDGDATAIAYVTLTTTGVDAIEPASENELMSTKRLDQRATSLEVWKKQAGDQLTTLTTDMTTLATKIGQAADSSILTRIFADVAAIKDALEMDDDFSGYGSENFLAVDQSISDPDHVGYYAKVEEGLRFPDANADAKALSLFNPIDPAVKIAANGLLLPKYTEVQRISVDTLYQSMSISQYEYQEVEFKQMAISAQRLRFGLAKTVCNNSEFWKTGKFDYAKGIFTDALGRTYQALGTDFDTRWTGSDIRNSKEKWVRLQQFWYDTETEYYMDRVVTEFTVPGSIVAQTFLNAQGGWLTSIDLFFTQVAATGNVRVLVCKTSAGKPDPARIIAETTLLPGAMVKGSNAANVAHWTRVPLTPTALEAGERYGIILVSGGNHFVGMASGAKYAAGTFFSSTDGAFLQGDLTLDMMFRANFASFAAPRIEVDLGSVNLSGGIVDIDIAYEGIVPGGTELGFEVRPEGNSRWYALGADGNPFSGLPALASLRAVLIGTKDLMPGFRLTGSRVKVSRPATTQTWFSEPLASPAPTQSIKIIVILDQFNEVNHDFDLRLNNLTGAVNNIAPSFVTDELIEERSGTRKRIRRTCEWDSTDLTTPTSSFTIKATGSLTAATEVFHGERLTWLTF